jgi:hypothetical protein
MAATRAPGCGKWPNGGDGDTAAELLALAQHARDLARHVPGDVMAARLLAVADDLEAQAGALEQHPP